MLFRIQRSIEDRLFSVNENVYENIYGYMILTTFDYMDNKGKIESCCNGCGLCI